LVVLGAPVSLGIAGFFAWAGVRIAAREAPGPGDGWQWVFWAGIGCLVLGVMLLPAVWVVYVQAAVTGRLAFRVDEVGVTLDGALFPPSPPITVPWRDIAEVVRYDVRSRYATTRYVGVRLRPEALRPPGVPEPGSLRARLRRINAGWTPLPVDIGQADRGWVLDDALLDDAVHRWAPGGARVVRWVGTRTMLGLEVWPPYLMRPTAERSVAMSRRRRS
jgi:hypothetical protein